MIARGRITIYIDMEGSDAYSVSLSSSSGIIKLSRGGAIGTSKRTYNVVSERNNLTSNGQNIVTEHYPLTTTIQAFRGSSELFYSTTTTKGAYTVTIHPKGCEAQISNGVLSILAVTDPTGADVILTVNCEGSVVFHKRYYITIVADGENGKPSTSYSLVPSVTQIGCNSLGSYEPSNFSVSLYSKTGDQDMLPYDAHIVVWGYDGSSWVKHKYVHGSSISVGSSSLYKQYCVKAYSFLDTSFDSESIATVSVNIVENGENFASGAMPRNCGEYDSAKHYEYNKDFRDIVLVKSGASSEVYQVASFGTSPTGAPPGNGWMAGNRNTFTAIDTALIDGADIAGFLFKDGVMQSRERTGGIANTVINGQTGEIFTRKLTAINADITGVINATSGKIGGWKIVGNKLEASMPLIGGDIISSLERGKMIIQDLFGYSYFNKDRTNGIYVNIQESSNYPNVGFSENSAVKISGYNVDGGERSKGNALELYSQYGLSLNILKGYIRVNSSEVIPMGNASRVDRLGVDWDTGIIVKY